ncbi:MAG TPA: peptidylprolyl isomerase, partial [Kofleriaceae bacterium]|nr:peptidylprolyl isomerase [Kofleriaceae bacterium]
MRTHPLVVVTLGLGLAVTGALGSGCQKASKEKPAAGSAGSGQGSGVATAGSGSATGSGSAAAAPVDPPKDIDSKDILARTETAPQVYVKHVLLGWKELASARPGQSDPRAAKRSNAEAAALAQEIAGKLKANPDSIDALIKESSEDPGSLTGEPYSVKADTPFVPEFKTLALRLKEKEVGIVKTAFGYHVMERVAPPPPDPLASNDILARPPEAGPVKVQHVLIGWKDTPAAKSGRGDPKAMKREKAEADKLAKEVLDKARAKGADMAKLMKEYSEDPGSKDSARVYDVSADAPLVEPFKDMALRLKENEVGMVKSPFGWHIMKRVPPPPPPPPDPLDSTDILKREPTTQKAKVKHILLGWKDVHASDPRAQARDRKTLEKLVKDTVAKLKGGAKIEPLMAELSEDPGSAKGGTDYDVTPDAGLVPPFKALS